MNKKVLSAILFSALFAGTGTFTSCIDNDEPAGIEELRGAKAELIRAKVAVEQANAAKILAEAEVQKADAAAKLADAAYKQAQAKQEEAKVAREEALTAAEKARYDKLIAQYKLEMEQYAADHQTLMAQKQKALAEAQYSYEMALKHIAIAKAILTDDISKATIESLETAVKTAFDAIYTAEGNTKSLQDQIRDAEEELYNAMLDKAAAQDGPNAQINYVPQLKLEVERAKADVAGEEAELAMLKELLEKDVETTDWRAEIEALSDSVKTLKLAKTTLGVEVEKALNSEEWLAANQKVNGVKNEDDELIKNGTEQDLTDAEALYNANANGGTYTSSLGESTVIEKIKLELSKIEIKTPAALNNAITTALNEYETENDVDVTAWSGNKFAFAKATYTQPEYDVELTAEEGYLPAVRLAQINYFMDILGDATVSDQNMAQKEHELEGLKELEEIADSIYNEVALPRWQSALAVMKGGAATYSIPAAETKKATDAIAAYNTKVAALSAAVDAHAAVYNNAVTAEYNKFYSAYYLTKFMEKALVDLASADVYGTSALAEGAINSALVGLTTDASKIAAIEALYVTKVNDDAATTTVNEKTQAQTRVDAAKSTSKTAAELATKTEELAKKETWTTNAKATVNADATVTEAMATKFTAIGNANTAVATAYATMSTAVANYLADAKKYCALVPAEGSVAVPAKAATYKPNTENAKLYAMDGAVIAEENIAKMVLLALSENESDLTAAWNQSSKAAFGKEGWYVVPAAEEVVAGSALANWFAAQADVENAEFVINSKEVFEGLIEELTEAKEALEAETAANEAKFAELKKAVEDADKANEEANAELDEIEVVLVGEMKLELAKIDAKIEATEDVIGKLQGAVFAHLKIEGYTDYNQYTDAEAFEETLQDAVEDAEDAVIIAEKAVLLAEKNLKLAEEGKYDNVADKQYALDKLNKVLEMKLKDLAEATANLEKALEIMAGE